MASKTVNVEATPETAATYDEAIAAGYWGTVNETVPTDSYTLEGQASIDVTSDEYKQRRAAEKVGLEISDYTPPVDPPTEPPAKSGSKSSGSSSSS